jgi:hypothetical protein
LQVHLELIPLFDKRLPDILAIHLGLLILNTAGEIYGGFRGIAMGGALAEAGLDLSVQAAGDERVAPSPVGVSGRNGRLLRT